MAGAHWKLSYCKWIENRALHETSSVMLESLVGYLKWYSISITATCCNNLNEANVFHWARFSDTFFARKHEMVRTFEAWLVLCAGRFLSCDPAFYHVSPRAH